MSKLFLAILITSFTCPSILFAQNNIQSKNDSILKLKFQSILDSIYYNNPETRGIGIYVTSKQKGITWQAATGKLNTKGNTLTTENPVNIASVTKVYLAATILKLIEKGKLNLETPIHQLLSKNTILILKKDSYELNKIRVKHLLSNTSGIYDFVNTTSFQKRSSENPNYVWTMNEQIKLAIDEGNKSFNAGEKFEYSETNYLLLAEIIERIARKPFYISVKELLGFKELGLDNTWFLFQENKPKHTLPYAEQTAKKYNVNSLVLNPSFDAFGGGGLASTLKDMATFGSALFEGGIFSDTNTINLMCAPALGNKNEKFDYALGLAITKVDDYTAYGHGGFWGTQLKYIPELGLTVAVFVLERDTWPVYNSLIEEIVKVIKKPSEN